MQRGTLNGSNSAVTSPTFGQCWTLDPTGNWRGFNESTNGSSWTLNQTRTANPVNEITGITNTVGSAWAATAYDAAGNITSMPRPATPTSGYTAIYDAWNRQVAIKVGASFVQQNQYDARNFRAVILSYSGGVLSETRHSYFKTDWRCIEERVGAATTAERQFVWGARYIDDLVERDRDTTGGGTLNQRMYAIQDANWNMNAITTTAGVVGERFAYSPYGSPTFLSPVYLARSVSSYAWETLYCGYRFDAGTSVFTVRNRSYNPTLGSWCQRDPISSLLDEAEHQTYVRNMPLSFLDSTGLVEENFGLPTGPGPLAAGSISTAAAPINTTQTKAFPLAEGFANLGAVIVAGQPFPTARPSIGVGSAAGRTRCTSAASTSAPNASQSPMLQRYLTGSGGRWGGSTTRQLNHKLATELENRGFTVTNGAGRASEEWIRG